MLLYEDYFLCNTSQSLHHCSKLDTTIYDIIFLPPAHTKKQSTSTIQWIDSRPVSSE